MTVASHIIAARRASPFTLSPTTQNRVGGSGLSGATMRPPPSSAGTTSTSPSWPDGASPIVPSVVVYSISTTTCPAKISAPPTTAVSTNFTVDSSPIWWSKAWLEGVLWNRTRSATAIRIASSVSPSSNSRADVFRYLSCWRKRLPSSVTECSLSRPDRGRFHICNLRIRRVGAIAAQHLGTTDSNSGYSAPHSVVIDRNTTPGDQHGFEHPAQALLTSVREP
ncbi:hypothetical protein NRB20_75500 [Nocardia sp. RB20]|uniref:Uncharacterized protein n=1 Tax=Nocardia macrotermitis TaxID=2585198 RepID=A0A7K0DF41_9NOCA|nr:hypothetical protein [Nocardia macrotermitis]